MLQIQKLKREEVCAVYNAYMVCDFDKEELKPLGVLLRLLENGLYACYGLFEDGTIQAYACFAKDTASRFLLLDYYAVCSGNRSRGYGSRFLTLLKPELSSFSILFAEVEDPAYFCSQEDRATKYRRIAFYEKNGFLKTNMKCTLFGHPYIIMTLQLSEKPDEREDMYQALRCIYHVMFDDRTYVQHVFLQRPPDE